MSARSKYQEGFSIIESLMIIIVLTLVGLGGWSVYSHTKPIHTAQANSAQVLHDVSNIASRKFHTSRVGDATDPSANITKQDSVKISTTAYGDASMNWKLPGNNYYVGLDARSVTFSYLGSSASNAQAPLNIPAGQKLYDVIKSQLQLDNFNQISAGQTVDDTRDGVSPSNIYAFQNSKADCSVILHGDPDDYFYISCTDIADVARQTKSVMPFAAAYLLANPTLIGDALFSNAGGGLTYASSNTLGYSLASIIVENPFDSIGATTSTTAYFYKKTGGTWQYTALNYGLGDGLGDVIVCEKVSKSTDAYLAYKGQPCTHNNADQTDGTVL